MKVKIIFFIISVFITLSHGKVYAGVNYYLKDLERDTSKRKSLQWANVGLGWSFKPNSIFIEGPEIGLNYNWLMKKITIQGNVSHVEKFSLGSSKPTTLNSISIHAGKHILKRYYTTGITLGPGIMWGNIRESNYYYIKYARPGIAANVMLTFNPIKNFGFGFEAFCYLNTEVSSTGVKFILHLNNKK